MQMIGVGQGSIVATIDPPAAILGRTAQSSAVPDGGTAKGKRGAISSLRIRLSPSCPRVNVFPLACMAGLGGQVV